MLETLESNADVTTAVMKFTRQLEIDCAEKMDIVTFIYAIRALFCWHRIHECTSVPEKVKIVRDAWIQQNDGAYSRWLLSPTDNNNMITWAKWTFHAKNSILTEALDAKHAIIP